MPRYAVLLDLDDPKLRPIALVTEHPDAVLVHFAVDCGLKSEYQAPYDVREPDGEFVQYRPGTPEYFNSVIHTLSRSFVVAELDEEFALSSERIAELYSEKVVLPRAPRTTIYRDSSILSPLWMSVGRVMASYVSEEMGKESSCVRCVDDDSRLARAA
jgi:hypothetical protein